MDTSTGVRRSKRKRIRIDKDNDMGKGKDNDMGKGKGKSKGKVKRKCKDNDNDNGKANDNGMGKAKLIGVNQDANTERNPWCMYCTAVNHFNHVYQHENNSSEILNMLDFYIEQQQKYCKNQQ